jgi:hypothetical protein
VDQWLAEHRQCAPRARPSVTALIAGNERTFRTTRLPQTSPPPDRQARSTNQLGGLSKTPPGELIDRIIILELKMEHVADRGARANVLRSLDALREAYARACRARVDASPALVDLVHRLRTLNRQLWDVEDDLRQCEQNVDFGARFVQLARSVYRYNDERASVKRAISERFESSLLDEKVFANQGEARECDLRRS